MAAQAAFFLLDPMQLARKVILIDATLDENSPGSVRRLAPRFSTDYPRTLAAHDIGLKDLLDAFYLLGHQVDVVLFAVSIAPLQELGLDMSPELSARVPEIAALVKEEISKNL